MVTQLDTHPIRKARERRGMSQTELGEIVGAQKAAVSKWESGKAFPEPTTAFKLASALRIRLEAVYHSARAV